LDVVGLAVGTGIGDLVGLRVVGLAVVGLTVGDLVGLAVGLAVVGFAVGTRVGTGIGDLVDLALSARFGDLVALAAFTAVGLLLVFDDFGAHACAKLNIKIARMARSLVMLIIMPVWVGERDREGGVRTVKNRITIFNCLRELLHEVHVKVVPNCV
jgi:hypothetical protein